MNVIEENYIELAGAIVREAIFDYKKALRRNKYKKIDDCEEFFLSPYGQMLSSYHGEYIIERCKKEVEAEKKKKKKE